MHIDFNQCFFEGVREPLRTSQYVILPKFASRKESAMKNDIDALIKDLKAAPLDRDLHNLEAEVWERIDARNPAGHPASPAAIATDRRLLRHRQ